MKKHSNTHKAPHKSKHNEQLATSHEDSAHAAAASAASGKIDIASADDVALGVQDNDRDAASLSNGSLSRASRERLS